MKTKFLLKYFVIITVSLMIAACGQTDSAKQNGNVEKIVSNIENKQATAENKSSQVEGTIFENECYGFDRIGLKPDTRGAAKYRCESAFILNNDGYFPTVTVLAYDTGSLEDAVKNFSKDYEKRNSKIERSQIKIGGIDAIRLDFTYQLPKGDNQIVIRDGKRVSEGKSYAIFVDVRNRLSETASRGKIGNIVIDGSLNQPEQEAILQRVVDSWQWK
jgi:hypothetical protein